MVFSQLVFPEFFSGVVRACLDRNIGPVKAVLRRKRPKDGFKITMNRVVNDGCLEFQDSFNAGADQIYKLNVKWPR